MREAVEPQTYLPGTVVPNAKLNMHIKRVANKNWVLNFSPPASGPQTPNPDSGNSFQSTPRPNSAMEHTAKKMHNLPASALNQTAARIIHRRTSPTRQSGFGSDSTGISDYKAQNSAPNTYGTGDGGRQDSTIINSMRNSHTRRNPNPRDGPNAGKPRIAGWNSGRNPNAGQNPNPDPNTGRNLHLNPAVMPSLNTGGIKNL